MILSLQILEWLGWPCGIVAGLIAAGAGINRLAGHRSRLTRLLQDAELEDQIRRALAAEARGMPGLDMPPGQPWTGGDAGHADCGCAWAYLADGDVMLAACQGHHYAAGEIARHIARGPDRAEDPAQVADFAAWAAETGLTWPGDGQ